MKTRIRLVAPSIPAAPLRLAAVLAILTALALVAGRGPSEAAAAKLDRTFGHGGRATPTFLPAFGGAGPEEPGGERVIEVPDPKGGTLRVNNPSEARSVERLDPDGSVERSLGCDVAAGPCSLVGIEIEAILPLPSGKVVVAGLIPADQGATRQIAVARFDESGRPDAGFGDDGVLDLHAERKIAGEELIGLAAGPNEDALVVINDENAKEDGSSVRLGGSKVVAVGLDGGLDPSYGSGGIVSSPDRIGAVEGLPGGGLLLTGEHWVGGPLARGLRARSSDVFLTRLTAAGAPDPAFGDGGTTDVDLGGIDVATALLSLPDGSIAVGGATTVSHLTCPYPRQLFCAETPALVGFTASGAVDAGFGEAGVLRLDQLTFDGAPVMAVGVTSLHDVAGGAVLAEGSTWARKFSAQIGPGGALDPSFGSGGIAVVTRTHKSGAQVKALATEASGRILALGGTNAGGVGATPAVFRFRPNGAVDRSFGGGSGFVRVPGHLDALAPDPRGGALVLAGKYSANTVIRVTASGALDPRFGKEGVAPLPEHLPVRRRGRSVKIEVTPRQIAGLPGGAVLVSAFLGTSQIELIRLTRRGALDPSFGHHGVVLVDVGTGGNSNPRAMTVLPGGDVLLAGAIRAGKPGAKHPTPAVIRLHPDGTLDRSFGVGGVATAPFPGAAVITAEAIGPGGEIVVRGKRAVKHRSGLLVARFSASGRLDRGFLDRTAGLLRIPDNAYQPPGVFLLGSQVAVPVSLSPDLLVLAPDGRYERRLTLGTERPHMMILTAGSQRGKLVVATRTRGERTFTLSRLSG